MSHIFKPVEAEVKDPALRDARNNDYDIQRLAIDGELLVKLVQAIDEMIPSMTVIRDEEAEGERHIFHEKIFPEILGATRETSLYTSLAITAVTTTAEQTTPVRETCKEYLLWRALIDGDAVILSFEDYYIEVFSDGTKTLTLSRSTDSGMKVVDALSRGESSPSVEKEFHFGAAYEATGLTEELNRLGNVTADKPDKVV